jgi:hypothetical protein
MYSDRDIEARFAWCDPAFLPEEEPEEENDEQIIMGQLFADLEKVFAKYDRRDIEVMAEHDNEVVDKIYELMEV